MSHDWTLILRGEPLHGANGPFGWGGLWFAALLGANVLQESSSRVLRHRYGFDHPRRIAGFPTLNNTGLQARVALRLTRLEPELGFSEIGEV